MDRKEGDILVALTMVSFFVSILFLYFFIYMYFQQRKLVKLQKEKTKAEIENSEREKKQIALELHNDISPFLASVNMRLDLLSSDNQIISDCKKVLDECIYKLRSMTYKIAPPSINEQSFVKSLEYYIQKTGLDKHIRIEIKDNQLYQLDREQHDQLYRIMQEVVLNTVKHSKATELIIEISVEANQLLIRTSDNGIGFDEKKIRVSNQNGLGLISIQSYVQFLNGSFAKAPIDIGGTKYNIRIPLLKTITNESQNSHS